MQLVINTYGSYLHRNKSCFEVIVEGKKNVVSTKKVESILIATGASISTDAIKLAIESMIHISTKR